MSEDPIRALIEKLEEDWRSSHPVTLEDLIPVHDALSLEWVLCRVDNPRPITSRAWTGGRDAPVSRAMPHARLLERRWSRSVCSWSDGMKPEVRS